MAGTQRVLVLCRLSTASRADLAGRFRLVDSYASPLNLEAFLASVAADDDPPRVALVSGWGNVPVDAGFLDAVPSLECVVTDSANVSHIDLHECARRGVAVANAAGVYSADVADHAIGLLIEVLRRVSAANGARRSMLGGKRVGVIGLGSIGAAIARRLQQAFGCAVSYSSRRRRDDVPYRYFSTVRDLAEHSDALVVACALTTETWHIVDGAVLDALGNSGVLVNVARGGNVDEAELVKALAEGRLAGAGLDVLEYEPKVPAELMEMDNVVLTPHQAAFTPESVADLHRLIVNNLEAFFARQPLLTPVIASTS
ncbi:glyoxylate/hydroxypyruvate reductase HPR3-like [Lolium rigidum]|uniref:glyoxylate/hydroxypyruvate reductase HPR3-like n=1 Tax=Lolium rigidum TaxID=89674 RepID=UPI001F5C886F|nr:glyoxylate/hydroxypyruvate reductase HPR3-like [Lolium rigidum]